MKHNSVWGKLLLLALSFVLAFSTLVSCTKDDIAALDKENDEIKTELGTTEENLAKLETLVNSIKVTADAAATKDALAAANAALEEVKATANAAATAAKLDEVKTALETALAGKADSAVKTELEAAIAAVKATADAAVTEAKLTAAKTALEDAIAGKADKTALEAAVAKITSLEEAGATDAELAAVKTALEATIAGKATAADITAAVAKVEEKLAAYAKAADVTALQETLSATATKVEKVATDLSKLLADFNALKATTEGLEAQLVAVQAALTALQAEDFAGKYKAATEMLYVDSEENEFSLADWDALVASVNEDLYTGATYAKFTQKATTLRFFLGRALTVEEIKGYFAELAEYKTKDMETFEQSLERIVLSYECGNKFLALDKATAATMTEIDEAYVGATNVGLEDTTLEARYNKIAAAYDNLEAADEASKVIEAYIAVIKDIKVIVYEDSKEAISDAVDAFTSFDHDFFQAKAEYLEYYDEKTTTELAAILVTDYDVMVAARDRLTVLENAWDNRVALSELALGFETNRPLYTDAEALAKELAAVKAWIAEYKLEDENVTKMYYTENNLITRASAYATEMNNIWTSFEEKGVKVAILDAIAALKGAEDAKKTLITEDATVKAIRALITKLDTEIKAVDEWTATDGNFAKMVGDLAKFIAVENRLTALNNANAALDAIYDEMVELIAKNIEDTGKGVTFEDWDKMVAWEEEIVDIYGGVEVDMKAEDANFVAIEKEKSATEKLAELHVLYEEITKDVRDIYLAVTEALKDADAVSLKFGYDLDGYMRKVLEIMALNVKDINLPLGEDEGKEINLQTLMNDLSKAITNYKERATAAQTAAAELKALITANAFTNLNANTLNDYAAIKEVYDKLVEWVEEYITPDVENINDDAAVVAALNALLEVPVYGDKTGAKWVFLAADVYTACVDKFDAADATKTAAKAEWEGTDGLKALLESLSNNDTAHNIHKLADYKKAAMKFAKYTNGFYGAAITSPEFNENAIFTTFSGFKDTCEAQDATAADKIEAILNAINALPALDETTFATILDQIDSIEILIAEYKDGYCADICAECIDPAKLLDLAKQKAAAQLVEYAYAAKQNANDATDVEIDKIVFMWDGAITLATTYDQIDSSLMSGKSAIANNYPCVVDATKDHTYGDDCVCDWCDDVRACVDAANDGDHKCDNCGKADITACADVDDEDHKCDECGELIAGATCADAADDGDHKCDECGELIAGATCTDTDADAKCDECGETIVCTSHTDTDYNGKCDICDADVPIYS